MNYLVPPEAIPVDDAAPPNNSLKQPANFWTQICHNKDREFQLCCTN